MHEPAAGRSAGDVTPDTASRRLHRTLGNQAVQRFAADADRPPFEVQPSDDACEREAARVADRVVGSAVGARSSRRAAAQRSDDRGADSRDQGAQRSPRSLQWPQSLQRAPARPLLQRQATDAPFDLLDEELTLERPAKQAPPPSSLFPTWRDLLPATEEEAIEQRLQWMLVHGPAATEPTRKSAADIFDERATELADDVVDSLRLDELADTIKLYWAADLVGVDRETVQRGLRSAVKSGLLKGPSAALGQGLDAMGLQGEPREAVETTVEALLKVRPGEEPWKQYEESQQGTGPVQRAPITAAAGSGAEAPTAADARPAALDAVRASSGRPLPAPVRESFEPHFGPIVDRARIHTGRRAREAAAALNASAFTVGSDVVFGVDEYRPGTTSGRRLLAHELTHVAQQSAGSAAAGPQPVQRQTAEGEQGVGAESGGVTAPPAEEIDPRLHEILAKARAGEPLTRAEIEYVANLSPAEVAYVKRELGREIVRQLMADVAVIRFSLDRTGPIRDFRRTFRGRLDLRLGGLVGAVAGSLEGEAEAEVEVVGQAADRRLVISVTPPRGANRLAAAIRQRLFPTERPREFDFEVSDTVYRLVSSVSLFGTLSVGIVGDDATAPNAAVTLDHESMPDGVALVVTLTQLLAGAPSDRPEREGPSDYSLLTPDPRAFALGGVSGLGGSAGVAATAGLDVPLHYDTQNPLVYGGLGVRGGTSPAGGGRLGGAALVGMDLDPLRLQMGIGAGAAFLPEPVPTDEGPAQTVLYTELEGAIGYTILSDVELLLMVSTGSITDVGGYISGQVGAGVRF